MCRQPPNPQISSSTGTGSANHQPQRSAGIGSAQPPQAGQSPSNGALAATALDNCHNSQQGDVAGNARDEVGGSGVTIVPSNSAPSSPDNASSVCQGTRA